MDKTKDKKDRSNSNLLTTATIKKRLNLQMNLMAAFIANSKNRTT